MQMNFHRKLPIPKDVKQEFPLTERMEQVKSVPYLKALQISLSSSSVPVLQIIAIPCWNIFPDSAESKSKYPTRSSSFRGFTPISPEQPARDIRACCISLIPNPSPICIKASWPFVNFIYPLSEIMILHVPMKCFILRITVTCPIFFPTSL